MSLYSNEVLDSGVFANEENKVKPRHYASSGQRLVNYLIDRVLVYIILVFFNNLETFSSTSIEGYLLQLLLTVIIGTSYYSIIESITGKSIGKLVTRTKVVNEDFSIPEPVTIIIKNLCRYIPFEAFSYLGNTTRGWHDRISKTYVINERTIS